jgi:predicted dithiol-disulfide oxidoreductase (DUF899 family)
MKTNTTDSSSLLAAQQSLASFRRKFLHDSAPDSSSPTAGAIGDSAGRAVVSREAWLAARRELLRKEKEFTKVRDNLSALRRQLPWVRLTKSYAFEGQSGRASFLDLFGPHRQLIVYHFMFGPGWEEGCKSCSFVSDHFDGMLPHLAARDVSFAAVSHAPWAEIAPFRERMGWKFPWFSSHGSDFNPDFNVSFDPREVATGKVYYNYHEMEFPVEEAPGISVFIRDTEGVVFHTYSTFSRGLDIIIGTYNLLDLLPTGRNEEGDFPMSWVRYHDRYDHVSLAR